MHGAEDFSASRMTLQVFHLFHRKTILSLQLTIASYYLPIVLDYENKTYITSFKIIVFGHQTGKCCKIVCRMGYSSTESPRISMFSEVLSLTLNLLVEAVVAFGKAFYPRCLVPWKRLKVIHR